jgi:A/G-specific adenine glycosylase
MPFPPAPKLLAPLAPWFDAERRDLPWRAADLDGPHPDPYAVLVSELMLQQTQVATVIPYFLRWMARFPDAKALACASEEEVHGHWAGLGYYRRARNLQAAASAIAQEGWPGDLEGLLALPGLGAYTAAAVAAQAFQWPTPALDGNAFRVLARMLGLLEDPRRNAGELRTWLAPALALHGPSRLTQAIMELGATLCTPAPRCGACPLRGGCEALRLGLQDAIPPAQPRTKVKEVTLRLAAIQGPQGWLLRPPRAKGLLAGLWSWPTVEDAGTPAESAAEAGSPYGLQGRALKGWVQVYSHRRETIRPLVAETPTQALPSGLAWITPARLAELPMGSRDQRLRESLQQAGEDLLAGDQAALAGILGPG